MQLQSIDTTAVEARRRRLATSIDGPALFFAGASRPRNYAGAPYPFRASSHFLYFTGLAVADAALLVDGEESTLFVHLPDAADELWHGPVPGADAIAEATGCRVRALEELADHVSGAATITAVDLATRARQRALFGRDPSDADLALADAVIASRMIHDQAAVAGLREAAEATTAAHLAGMKATRPGLREWHVRAAMESALLERGMTTAYNSIVTVHGEVLHNEVYHHAIEAGDLLLADVGAESRGGWAGDVTRTWPVSGRFSETQRAIYEVVLAGQLAAIDAIRPGARYRDVHLTAARAMTVGLIELGIFSGDPDELVADGAHALFFPHGVGHLIGLDVHDMEDLGDRAGYAPTRTRAEQFGLSYLRLDRDLEPGMAVTIEPGFYQVPAILRDESLKAMAGDRLNEAALARFADVRGIRIEDDILVTADGSEVLTPGIPKQVADVEAAVG